MAKHHENAKRTELVSCWITPDEKSLLKVATPKGMSESEFASTVLMNFVKKVLIEKKSKQKFIEPQATKVKKIKVKLKPEATEKVNQEGE